MSLTETSINGFYFEFGEIPGNKIAVCGFVTPQKPSVSSNPVPNEGERVQALQEMFSRLTLLGAYVVKYEQPTSDVKAQGLGRDFKVMSVRGAVWKRDSTQFTIDAAIELVRKNLSQPPV